MLLETQQKIVECVLYILRQTRGADMYHVFKILYFADRYHLSDWGTRMIEDQFYAMEYGPVPSALYDAIKGQQHRSMPQLLGMISESVHRGEEEDTRNILFPKRDPHMDYLSTATIDALNKSIIDNINLSFHQLVEKSHDSAWEKAYSSEVHKMLTADIAEASGVNKDLLCYIKEKEELKKAFVW